MRDANSMGMKFTIAALSIATACSVVCAGDWSEKVDFGGDFYFRNEYTDRDDKDARFRNRFRIRIGAGVAVNEDVKLSVRLASGSAAPYTAAQTLDGAFSSKAINLDRAYFEWTMPAVAGMTLTAGKMANPLLRVDDLIWDGDVNPEGAVLSKSFSVSEKITIVPVGGSLWLEERAADSDTLMHIGQIAVVGEGGGVKFTAGVTLQNAENMKGFQPLYDTSKGFGNSTSSTNAAGNRVYDVDFNCVEGFVKATGKMGSVPLSCHGQYVVNTEADADDTGYLVGVKVGKAKKPGSMQFAYNYRELEKDAVIGVLADSNSWGGGTDGRGHKVAVAYQLADSWQLAATGYVNDRGLASKHDFTCVRLDVKATF
jgi:hypothetical protein